MLKVSDDRRHTARDHSAVAVVIDRLDRHAGHVLVPYRPELRLRVEPDFFDDLGIPQADHFSMQ